MKYVLTFAPKTAGYRCHWNVCSAAKDSKHTVKLPTVFDSIADARKWADADESDKAGEPTRANFKACSCCRMK